MDVGEWRNVELGDLCTRITSGGTPKRSCAHYYAGDGLGGFGHPWVKSSELRDRYVRETDERISELGLTESAAKLLPPETVLVAMYGATAGRVGLLTVSAAVNQAVCALVPDRHSADSVFLFHALRSQYLELAGKSTGAAQQNLNAKIVRSFSLVAPNVATQRRIAAVLSAFDELIEINERRIELLKELARSLYREWFVRFRFPGHEEVELVDSELGPIPEGWEVQRLGDIAAVNEQSFKAADLPDPFLYLDISAVGVGRIEAPSVIAAAEAPGRARRRVRDGDVVWATVRPNRRAHGLIHDPPSNLVASTGLAVLSPAAVPSSFLYEHAAAQSFTDFLVSQATGSAYPAVRPNDFCDAPVLVPPHATLDRFDAVVDRALRTASSLRSLCHQLAATRDLLLPRLVTGRLDISDVDLGVLTPSEAG
jgi:type I restriction enzyme S subunit